MKSKSSNSKNSSSKGGYSKSNHRKHSPDKKSRLGEENPKMVGQPSLDSCHTNDISWYNKSVLFGDSTNVPFNRIMGDSISLNNPTLVDDTTRKSIPGIMAIDFVPGIGWATDSNSSVNRCFNSMYQMIYSRTTGAMQFQQADLALFVLAMSSIMCLIGMVKRAIGISQVYANKNFYYPSAILQMLQITPSSVMGLQNVVRQKLNQVILNFNQAEIPNFVDIFKRQYSLSYNIWADEDSTEAQLYAFVAQGYYLYHDINGELPSYLEYKPISSTPGEELNITTVIGYANTCLEAWRNSSDFGIINGAIARAYPNSELLKLEPVLETDIVIPTFDPVMLWQINNMNGVGNVLDLDSLDVTQDVVANVLNWKPKLTDNMYSKLLCTPIRYLNAPDVAAANSKDFVMEATRLMVIGKIGDDGHYYLENCFTEIPLRIKVGVLERINGVKTLVKYDFSTWNLYQRDETFADRADLMAQGILTQFRSGPIISNYSMEDATATTCRFETLVGDIQVYTTVDFDSYTGLNNAALQSMYVIQPTAKEIR